MTENKGNWLQRMFRAKGNPQPTATAARPDTDAPQWQRFGGEDPATIGITDMREADFYAGMRVQLVALDHLPDEHRPWGREYQPDVPARPFTTDTALHLSFAGAPHPHLLTAAEIADRGPVQDLYRMGYRNLWQELVDSDIKVTEFRPDEQRLGTLRQASPAPLETSGQEKCWLFKGSSDYLGSAPIFVEELFGRYLPEVDHSNGIIFAMPHRHLMIAREVTSGSDLMTTIGLMATLTAEQFTTMPGTISPRLHLLHLGEVHTFTDVTWGGGHQVEIQVKPTGYLMGRIGDGLEGFEGMEGED